MFPNWRYHGIPRCVDSCPRLSTWHALTRRQNAPKSAVTVHAGAVTLLFPSSREQRLSLIHVALDTSSPLSITYEGVVLASRSHPLTRSGVARALGPTYAADGAQRLAYPGVTFELSGSGREDAVVSLSVAPREEGVLPSIEPLLKCTIQVGIVHDCSRIPC